MTKKVSIKNPRKIQSESPEEWVSNREGTKRLTFDVSASFHEKLKIASAKLGQSMGSIVIDGANAYIDAQL